MPPTAKIPLTATGTQAMEWRVSQAARILANRQPTEGGSGPQPRIHSGGMNGHRSLVRWLAASAALCLPFGGSAQAQSLAVSGSCPAITVDVTGATPGGDVALMRGMTTGSDAIGSGPCAGTATDLSSPVRVALAAADASGALSISGSVAPGACGKPIQVLDVTTCTVSPAVSMPAAVDADGDGFLSGTDCDDSDPEVYPGAPEYCDGIDANCDGNVDIGIASRELAGVWTDATSELAAGSYGAPASISLAEDETLWVCDGTWYISLNTSAWDDPAGALRGLPGRRDDTILTAGAGLPVLDSANVHLVESLTFRDAGSSSIAYSYGPDLQIQDIVWEQSGHLDILQDPVTISDSEFRDNVDTNGGALVVAAHDALVENSLFVGNEAAAGGAIEGFGLLQLVDVELSDNIATGSGGAIAMTGLDFFGAVLLLDTVVFDGNSAGGNGGAASVIDWHASVDAVDSMFTNNTAGGVGGAVYSNYYSDTDGMISGNTAGSDGGALYVTNDWGLSQLTRTILSDNTATGSGGAMYFWSGPSTADVEVHDNIAGSEGGGLYTGYATLTDLELLRNEGSVGGNVFIWEPGADVTLTNVTMDDGVPQDLGISTGSTVYVYDAGGTVSWVCGPSVPGCM